MDKRERDGEAAPETTGIVVGTGKKRRFHVSRSMAIVGACVFVVLVIAGGITYVVLHQRHAHQVRVAEQQKLQSNVSDANAIGDPQKLKADSTTLIDGAKSGKYSVSNTNLAKAYTDRGYVELSANNYQPALDDFRKAEQTDPTNKDQAQYGEFLARYHLGERKTLVPLLQEMEKPLQNNHDIGAPQQLAQYDGYITDLQAGKDLEL